MLVCSAHLLHAQVPLAPPAQDEVEQLIDGSSDEDAEEAGDLERITELRGFYLTRPLDLNTASADAFAALNLLTAAQIAAIVKHRQVAGAFVSVLELQSLRNMSLADVRLLLPYVHVPVSTTATVASITGRLADATRYVALRSGYQTTSSNVDAWLGPRLPLYLRARLTAGRQLSVGLVVENDAGERFGGKANPLLFDYVSAHAYADELPGLIRTVAVGDYGVSWGQGLINYSGFGTGKGALVMNVQRNDVRPKK